jgi:ABC-2 type transport system ATP-binding protein
MTTPAIETTGLTKDFRTVKAVDALDLTVNPGEVFGFLGPNGAGKTTTIRMLLDFIRPTAGAARVLGLDAQADPVAIRRRIGYLPAELTLDPKLTAGRYLDYLGYLQGGIDKAWRAALVERFGLDEAKVMKTMSSGNKKKVGIVQAFMHRPDLLILDEPTSGLDPLLQRAFLDLVRVVVKTGATVFLSSHDLAEVEDAADRVGILRAGRLVAVDTVPALTAKAQRHFVLRFAAPVPAEAFANLPGVAVIEVDGAIVKATIAGSPDALVKAAAGFELLDLSPRERELDQVFLTYYREAA